MAYLYGRSTGELRLQARVYHDGEDRSVIYFKLRTRDLLYRGAGEGTAFRSNVRISYAALPTYGSKTILDSASTLVRDSSTEPHPDKELIGTINIARRPDRAFVLRITAHDLNRDLATSLMVNVPAGPHADRLYYLTLDTLGYPLFDDHLARPNTVVVRCERLAGRTLHGAWFNAEAPLPAPVFSTAPRASAAPKPDSTFQVLVDAEGHFRFTTGDRGFYHFRADTTYMEGLTLFVLRESYPEVRNAKAMLPPLRYITSMQEYDGMRKAPDPRKALERFWQDAAGDRERARELIRTYYMRVENANRHFTAHCEGWKTDRGLVHMIFGTPNVIYRNDRNETWIYGEETNLMSLTFNFVKRENPFTDNDMVLERDPQLKGAWYRNVESWRNGRIFQN
ncbi:MAG: GWxTD domain-containing protein [Flavobacteriales bacterium]|nr:GWxTD domain-containing protein [Flavobacteriales bacterium]